MLPKVMGILNVTPDSFSDGGRLATTADAVRAAAAMMEAGASIIDIGGESTRPGALEVPAEEELGRVLPVLRALAAERIPTSIDTRKAAVMRAALDTGAAMINDVSALLFDPESLGVAANSDAQVVLMHHQGTPETMQANPRYADVVAEVRAFLAERVAACEAAGVARARLVVDPGIGFGKTVAHNLALLRNLSALAPEGVPLLLGASRKKLIEHLAGPADAAHRLGGSLALALHAAANGAAWVRVHDVQETMQALRVQAALA
jgi:dihydropteroate synthase